MFDQVSLVPPPQLSLLKERLQALGFNMACEDTAGALLRALAATKRSGRLLELGTGTGVGTAWLLHGMDSGSELVTVDIESQYQDVARTVFAADPRVKFVTCDAVEFLESQPPESFDLVFADAMPGKFLYLDSALRLIRAGGCYVVDDLLPQENWPPGHQTKVTNLLETLSRLDTFRSVLLNWSSGIMIPTRI
ncbi:MAG: hypothetical protein NVS9B14_11580 [Candidatus Acidiferrum sp.]